MTDALASTFPTDRCPLCGRANQGAMASQATPASCWCQNAQIPAAVLAKIPAAAQGRACICARCCDNVGELPPGVVETVDPGGRTAVALEATGQRVLISTTGAQVLSWHRDGNDVLWTASASEYTANNPERSVVPVVFPWFGDRKLNTTI